jgi:hypothetical protein
MTNLNDRLNIVASHLENIEALKDGWRASFPGEKPVPSIADRARAGELQSIADRAKAEASGLMQPVFDRVRQTVEDLRSVDRGSSFDSVSGAIGEVVSDLQQRAKDSEEIRSMGDAIIAPREEPED